MVAYDDLPKHLQQQVLEKIGRPPRAKRSRKGDSRDATDGRCFTCGESFTSVRRWEEHTAANPGHRRLELMSEGAVGG
jgi:hypothetical protein